MAVIKKKEQLGRRHLDVWVSAVHRSTIKI
jgi:hypothetical protein